MSQNNIRYIVQLNEGNDNAIVEFQDYLNKKNIEYKYLSFLKTFIIDAIPTQIAKISKLEYITMTLEDIIIEDAISCPLPPYKILEHGPKLIYLNYGINQIKAPELWKKCINGKDINVAIFDNGVVPHIALKIKDEISFVPGESPSDGIDIYTDIAHGTHIAGIIGGKDYDSGTTGVAYGCNLFNVKVIDVTGCGYWSYILEGINWCILNNINIINLGFSFYDIVTLENKPFIENTIKLAAKLGIIIVAPAGNNSYYPEKIDEVIIVSAVDKHDNLSMFTNYGEKVDYVAPGVAIESTGLDNDTIILSGNAMAAAHVTGLIALILSDDIKKGRKLKSQVGIKSILNLYCKKLKSTGNQLVYGNGRVEVPTELL